ncbi:MAG: hypothetical protein HYS12_12220, partial [Planctomycetes bacterium]|nr:hypothetical protein [Planctomycetota bacterium]
MNLLPPLLLLLSSAPPQDYESTADPAQLREVLYDQQDVRQQSQAALLLVRDRSPAAEEIVHRGLRQTTSPEVFLALASAVRAAHDARFTEELLGALSVNGPGARPAATCWRGCPEAAAEALAAVADAGVVQRLRKMLHDDRADPSVR